VVQLKKPSKKNPIKKTNQKNLVKWSSPNQLLQNGTWSSWIWGQKDHMGGFFDQNSQ
jgi:hypothetical protein